MPRGFTRALYVTDGGALYSLLVDADSVLDPNRGWGTVPEPAPAFAPRGFLPRRVLGIDESGLQQECRVGTNDCALWQRVVSTFTVEGSDGLRHTAAVVKLQGERQVGPKSDFGPA